MHQDLRSLLELCLHNAPNSRPTTPDLLHRVHDIRIRVDAREEVSCSSKVLC